MGFNSRHVCEGVNKDKTQGSLGGRSQHLAGGVGVTNLGNGLVRYQCPL